MIGMRYDVELFIPLFLYILKGQLFFRSNQKVKLLTEISYMAVKNAEKWCYASAPEFPSNSVDTVVSTCVWIRMLSDNMLYNQNQMDPDGLPIRVRENINRS